MNDEFLSRVERVEEVGEIFSRVDRIERVDGGIGFFRGSLQGGFEQAEEAAHGGEGSSRGRCTARTAGSCASREFLTL